MSTSGTYNFSVSRDDIIRQAMLNIKRLDPTESPTAQETTDCARVLNMLVKQWMGKADFAPGLKTWTRQRSHLLLASVPTAYQLNSSAQGWTNALVQTPINIYAAAGATGVSLTSVASVAVGNTIAVELDANNIFYATVGSIAGNVVTFAGGATLPSSASSGQMAFVYAAAAQAPLYVEAAVLRDENNTDVPLRIFADTQSYDVLSNKWDPTNLGDPAAVLIETGINTATLYIDVGGAQDVGKHIVLTNMQPVQDFDNPLDTPYYPQEWYLALCWGLTEQICPMFGATWTPLMAANKEVSHRVAGQKEAEKSSLFFMCGAED